jgi:uncharacterized protein
MAKKTILKDKPEKLIKKYYQVLKKANIPVEKIIMFGSWAKGEEKYWSDLDLCVVSPSFGKNNFDETVKLKKATTKVDNMIEPHPYHPKDLKDKWIPLAVEILKYGKVFNFK